MTLHGRITSMRSALQLRAPPRGKLVIAVVAAVGITATAIPLAVRNVDTPTLAAMDIAGTAPPKWEDGYRHLVVTYDAKASDGTSNPAAPPSDAGSQKTSDGRPTETAGRWIAISQGGVDHRMTPEQRAALVPWIRVYAAGTDGAVWGQLDPAAPAELGGQAPPSSIQGQPLEQDTSATHTDPKKSPAKPAEKPASKPTLSSFLAKAVVRAQRAIFGPGFGEAPLTGELAIPPALAALTQTTAVALGDNRFSLRTTLSDHELAAIGVRNITADPPATIMTDRLPSGSNDPAAARQWALQNTGTNAYDSRPGDLGPTVLGADADVPAAWARTRGAGATIAIIDAGIEPSLPDLAPNLWRNPGEICDNGVDDNRNSLVDDCTGWNFANNTRLVGLPNGSTTTHGTSTAGIAAAVAGNDIGIAGVAPEATLMMLNVANTPSIPYSACIRAIDYAVANGADIINASWGGTTPSAELAAAIARAEAAGVLFIAAAGNSAADTDRGAWFPMSYPNVLSVGATTPADSLAYFSNRGANTVKVLAPGVGLVAPTNTGLTSFSGTSGAAPLVAGVAALLAAADPSASPARLRSAIMDTAVRVPALAGHSASGRIDAAAAVSTLRLPVSLTFAGFERLRAGAAQSTTVTAHADTTSIPTGTALTYRLELGSLAGGTMYSVADQPIVVTLPDSQTVQLTTGDDGSVLLPGSLSADSALGTTGLAIGIDTNLPSGAYALVTSLIDADTGSRYGDAQAVVFDVYEPTETPFTRAAPATAPPSTAPPSTASVGVPTGTSTTSPSDNSGSAPQPGPGPGPAPAPAPAAPTTPPSGAPPAPTTTAPSTSTQPEATPDPRTPRPVPTTTVPSGSSTPSAPTVAPVAGSSSAGPTQPPPRAPSAVHGTAGDATLTLAWTRAVGSVTGYLVWVDGSLTRMTTGTEVTITGLSNGREYRLSVSAVGPGGESPRSTDVFVTPRNSGSSAGTPLIAAPRVYPSNGSTAGGSSVTISGASLPANVSIVAFGNQLVPVRSSNSPTSVTVMTPPRAAGTVDVTLFGSESSMTIWSAFSYVAMNSASATTSATDAGSPKPSSSPLPLPSSQGSGSSGGSSPSAPTTTAPATAPTTVPAPAPSMPKTSSPTPTTAIPSTTPAPTTTAKPAPTPPASPLHLRNVSTASSLSGLPVSLLGAYACRSSRCPGVIVS